MAINRYVAYCISRCFSSLRWDALYAHEFFDAMPKILNHPTRWQWTVDLIYRLLISDLILMSGWKENLNIENKNNRKNDALSYTEKLASTDPLSSKLNEYIVWQEFDLSLSDAGKQLVSIFFPDHLSDEHASRFIEKVECQFKDFGVPWKEEPLVKICCRKGRNGGIG